MHTITVIKILIDVKVKGKCKVHPRTGHEVPDGE
jgi:hypothetical protein